MTSLFQKIKCAITLGQGVLVNLPEPQGNEDPFELFKQWLKVAEESGIILPESMTLSTVDSRNRPSTRVVLLKELNADGFVFFTNYHSRKAQELEANPYVCLTFHWNILQRQVRIEGSAKRISTQDSEQYFHSRPRGSQIGAWASHQSETIESRQQLQQQVAFYTEKFADKTVPLPEFWGGYLVQPERIEFWQGKADRLHDRFCFERETAAQSWDVKRLSP